VVALQVVERLDEEEEEKEEEEEEVVVVEWEVPIAEESASGYSARMRTWI
jgi:hypothetical protein